MSEAPLAHQEFPILGRAYFLGGRASTSLKRTLMEAGVDVEQGDFWQKGFRVIRRLIDELKSLGPWDKICVDPPI
jgi:hypothetical protein